MNIALYVLTYLFYHEINRRRDATWKSLSVQVCIITYRLSRQTDGIPWPRNNRSTLKPPKMWGTKDLILGLLTDVDTVL